MADTHRRAGPHHAERAAGAALAVTVLLTVAKLWVWLATGSLSVLSQALDSALDIVALGLVFIGVRIARKPADATHHYGHGKVENLVAFTQTLFLGAIVAAVAVEAGARLGGTSPPVEAPWYSFAILGASALIDVVRVRSLTEAARVERSDALRAGALNIASDIGTAIVAIVSLALFQSGVGTADAWGSLVVVAVVAFAAVRLGKRSVDVLMDRAPVAPVEAIARAAASAPGVAETRRVRVRDSGGKLFADVTVAAGRTASLERAHDIAEGVEREIAHVAPGADVVVHIEPAAETGGLVERVQAAASRAEGVHEIHNVLVHAFTDGGRQKLHVTLHAKVPPGVSVEEAHALSDAIEASVAGELPEGARVDTHIEPLEPTTLGRDVTRDRDEVVSSVRALALEEADVLDCHEVLLTQTGSELSVVAHVRGRKDLPLDRIHSASTRIENGIRAAFPEVGPILIHFEPA